MTSLGKYAAITDSRTRPSTREAIVPSPTIPARLVTACCVALISLLLPTQRIRRPNYVQIPDNLTERPVPTDEQLARRNDCGINHKTAASWLSILEASFIAFRLAPHHRSFRKRLVKTPKLYFWDVGLAARLLGIESAEQLTTHPLRGSLFENWVIVELLKGRFNRGRKNNFTFWRNNTGLEVDLIAEQSLKLRPIEIKSGATLSRDWLSGLRKWLSLAEDSAIEPTLVYGGDTDWREDDVSIIPWRNTPTLAGEL